VTGSRESLRIALLTYRGHPHVGGQGVYVHYLSRALADLGHHVEVFSGQPYPELHESVSFTPVPSLDLYRPEDPFRTPSPGEFRGAIDALEYLSMCAAGFPEPLTFSLRVARLLEQRIAEFDLVHDNQSLGYGLLKLLHSVPVVATVHHPISIDRRHDLAAATGLKRKVALRRWYGFTRMQARVARRLTRVVTVSEGARTDIMQEFGVAGTNVSVVHNGVDPDLFRPLSGVGRRPGRVITLASSEAPMKGLTVAMEALAKVLTERDAELVVVGKGGNGPAARAAVARWGLEDAVVFEGAVDSLRLVELFAQSEVALVPSLYEGFSLPAIEAMACGVPLVATTVGALPEIAGPDGAAALLVRPGDPGAMAAAIGRLLDDPPMRARLGGAGRERAVEHFSWRQTARATVDRYRESLPSC
jgi:glycosyltransferase involved in cell wall biosynthesis